MQYGAKILEDRNICDRMRRELGELRASIKRCRRLLEDHASTLTGEERRGAVVALEIFDEEMAP